MFHLKTIRLIISTLVLVVACHVTETLCCYSVRPQFLYSYQWKHRKEPIYSGNSAKELLEMCLNGCGSGCPIVDCDASALLALQQAQKEVKDYQEFAKGVLLYLVIRCVPLLIIILMNIYLFWKGHFRFQDLWSRGVDTQWQLEEDPTSGLETHIWENMKITAEKTTDRHAKPDRREGYILNPIRRGNVFWAFRKIMSLFYGRERYYRYARRFNPLKWQIHNFGTIALDEMKKPEEPKEPPKYDWKADLNRGEVTPGLMDTIVGPVKKSILPSHTEM